MSAADGPCRPFDKKTATFVEKVYQRINLLTFSVVVGQGTRLFPDAGPDTALELVESRATPPAG